MYIQEAVKESMEKGKWIRQKRHQEDSGIELRILPTDTDDCCIIASFDKKTGIETRRSRRWNPSANDLTAGDWEVIEGGEGRVRKMNFKLKGLRKDRELLRKQLALLAKMSKDVSTFDYDEIVSVTNSMNNIYGTLMKSEIVLFTGLFVCTYLLARFFIHVKKLFRSNA